MQHAARTSRALLLPGPQAPISPLGTSLLSEAVRLGLRYAFYQLGLPLPEPSPVAVLDGRLALDGTALTELLAPAAGGGEVVAALLDPGGAGSLPPEARRLAAAASFHRLRLTVFPSSRILAGVPSFEAVHGEPRPLWQDFRHEVERREGTFGEAMLAELLAALKRRDARARGKKLPPCLSREAWRLRQDRRVALELFGPPDPLFASWARQPEQAQEVLAELAGEPVPPADPLRGRFRHLYRACLDRWQPHLEALAACAVHHGLLAETEDLYFLTSAEIEALFSAAGDAAALVALARAAFAAAWNQAEPEGRPRPGPEREGLWRRSPLAPLP